MLEQIKVTFVLGFVDVLKSFCVCSKDLCTLGCFYNTTVYSRKILDARDDCVVRKCHFSMNI